jgi:hypothetical protein
MLFIIYNIDKEIIMNIFVLDNNLKKCAEYHCDKHVCKMLIEYAQLLCSVYYYTDEQDNIENIYKLAHKNHPCTIWVRQSLSNWLWLWELGLFLYKEYKYRYNKIHKSGELILNLPIPNLKNIGLTKQPQCMDDIYKKEFVIEAYRNYYNEAKKKLFSWKNRKIPEWIIL